MADIGTKPTDNRTLSLLNGTRYATAAALASAGVAGYKVIKERKQQYDERNKYTARVNESAYVYRRLMDWIDSQVSSRRIVLLSRYHGISRYYDGSSTATVRIDGHPLSVTVEKPNLEALTKLNDPGSSMFSNNLVFTSKNAEAIDALQELLVRLTKEQKNSEREVLIYNPNGYGSWDGTDFTYRDLDSVILPLGVKEDFLEDIGVFLNNEQRYQTMGIPWHRGYLLWGEPGNGKSSLVSALANKYHFSLYNLPLSGVKDDKHLGELISRIQANSILLLEDIDIFSKSMTRDQADTGPTLAGLLNALDGVNTPHGLLTFITTNRKDILDAALTRPGRIDYSLELSSPDLYQIEKMFFRVYEENLDVQPRDFSSMAELSNVFKSHPNDVESARLLIKRG